MDRGACWATVHGVTKNWTRLSDQAQHVYLWLIHVGVWQKPSQYCKVISLQLKIKLN